MKKYTYNLNTSMHLGYPCELSIDELKDQTFNMSVKISNKCPLNNYCDAYLNLGIPESPFSSITHEVVHQNLSKKMMASLLPLLFKSVSNDEEHLGKNADFYASIARDLQIVFFDDPIPHQERRLAKNEATLSVEWVGEKLLIDIDCIDEIFQALKQQFPKSFAPEGQTKLTMVCTEEEALAIFEKLANLSIDFMDFKEIIKSKETKSYCFRFKETAFTPHRVQAFSVFNHNLYLNLGLTAFGALILSMLVKGDTNHSTKSMTKIAAGIGFGLSTVGLFRFLAPHHSANLGNPAFKSFSR